jgi:hypothetical protein
MHPCKVGMLLVYPLDLLWTDASSFLTKFVCHGSKHLSIVNRGMAEMNLYINSLFC